MPTPDGPMAPRGELRMVVLVFELPNGDEERWTVNTEQVDAVLMSEKVMDLQFPDSTRRPLTGNQELLIPGEVTGPGEPPAVCVHTKMPYCNIQCVV